MQYGCLWFSDGILNIIRISVTTISNVACECITHEKLCYQFCVMVSNVLSYSQVTKRCVLDNNLLIG